MNTAPSQAPLQCEVFKGDGTAVQVSSYWEHRPVLINFLRHFGCQFCREFVTQLRRAYPDIVERGAAVVVVAQGSPEQAAHFSKIYQLPFPVLADPSRQAYVAFGLEEGPWTQTFNPVVAARMVGKAAQGYWPGIVEHVQGLAGNGISLRQLGGTFILDRGGEVRYAHVATQVYKSPSITELLTVLDSFSGQ